MNEMTISQQKAIGQIANQHADQHAFEAFFDGKAANTLRSYETALDRFVEFLDSVQFMPSDMRHDPLAWRNVTHGLVKAFKQWLLNSGDSIATVNARVAVVRKFVALAFEAGCISGDENERIQGVKGYGKSEAVKINQKRQTPRKGHKKAKAVKITDEHAKALKTRPMTPQGARDAVIMCLLLDHGLRVGELAELKVSDIDLESGEMTFYRSKVDKTQTHILSGDTRKALAVWLEYAPKESFLLRASRKGGELTDAGMTTQAITYRVNTLGKALGIERLSAHDCRHYWTTYWSSKVSLFRLQEAGGWSSLAMPRRYVDDAKIANEGMVE